MSKISDAQGLPNHYLAAWQGEIDDFDAKYGEHIIGTEYERGSCDTHREEIEEARIKTLREIVPVFSYALRSGGEEKNGVDHIADLGRKVEAQPLHPLPMPPYGAQSLTNTEPSLRAESERLRKERDAALEAEDEAKDCYWAVYPTYVAVHGEGMSAEAAHTELSDRATTAEAKLEEAVKVIEEMNKWLEYLPSEYPDDAEMVKVLFAKAKAFITTLGEK